MHRFTLFVVVAAALAASCAGTVGYSATVSSDGYGPDLVYAAPGVQVIADYDEPIFYADSLYWRFDGRTWYRSSTYTGGWVYATPPAPVLRIERPHQYVHYRPQGWVARRTPARQAPVVRDNSDNRPRVESRPGPAREDPRDRDRKDHDGKDRDRKDRDGKDRDHDDDRDHRN